MKKTPPQQKMPAGRPTIFNKELADTVCARIAEGESLRSICADPEMPSVSSIIRWLLDEDKKEFWVQYAHARAAQAELMFDELLEIADDGSNDYMTIVKGSETYNVEDREVTNRSKLRVDTRKWYLSKVLPKKFGDKLDLTSDGKALPTPIYGGKSDPKEV
jgi:hypothetical protein